MSTSRKQIASPGDEATSGFSLLNAITKCFKAAGLAVMVWCWGYMEFSIGWLFMALFFHIVNEEFRTFKESKKAFAQHSLVSEKEAIESKLELDDYPSWVYFPEAEKAQWFNKIMTQMWPYIGEYVEDLMRTTVQQSIRGSLPNKFQNFSFETIDLGDVSPSIDNIVTCHDVIVKDEIVCDVEFRYNGDAVIKMNMAGGMSAGIKHLSVSGKMRAIMKPLVAQAPFIGAVTVFFLNRPKVNFDLTEVANLGDIFGFSKLLRDSVEKHIAQYLVVPNRIPVALVPGIDMSKLKHPMPKGVIHLLIIEARNLKGADSSVIGNSRSDPYCIIQVGAKEFRSKTVKNTTSPLWNEHFELIIDESFGQFISIDVTDEDTMDRDDSLGIVNLSVEAIVKQKSVNVWQKLENVTTGSIHVTATWYRLCADIEEMKKRREIASKTRKSSEETLSTGLLLCVLESADEISRSDKADSLRNVYARITVGHDTQESSVQYKTNKPRWDESFQFLVDDPETRHVTIELWHKGSTKDKKLGAATVPVNVVLTMDNMMTVKQIAMSDVSPSCTLTIHLSLRIMMRHITKACLSSPATVSDDLLPPNINNNNANAAAMPELISPELTTPEVTTAELTSHSARVDDKAMAGDHTSSAGESASPASVTGDVVEAVETKDSTASADLSSAGSLHPYGEIEVTIHYSPQNGHLVVIVHQCRNLIPCDKDNLADPYVRMYVMPDHSSETKRKTKLVKNSLNPVFDESFEWPLTFAEAQSAALDIAVKNDVGLFSSSRTEMGRVVVKLSDLEDITKPTKAWYDLSEKK